MNATTLYVEACKCMLSVCDENPGVWEELLQLLPKLRQALSCRVCRGLSVDPFGSLSCQHYVCRGCLRKKRALNPGCRWCLNLEKLQEDRQTRIVLACYQKLCEFIAESPAIKRLTTLNGEYNTTLAILHEAISSPISMDGYIKCPKQVPAKRSNDPFSHAEKIPNANSNDKMAAKSRDCQEQLPAEVVQISKRKLIQIIGGLDGSNGQIKDSKIKKKKKHFKGSIYNYNKKKKLKKLAAMARGINGLEPINEHIVETITNDQDTNEDIQVVDDVDAETVSLEMMGNSVEDKKTRGKRCKCGSSSLGSAQRCVGRRCPCYLKDESCEQCFCCNCGNPFNNNNVRSLGSTKVKFIHDEDIALS